MIPKLKILLREWQTAHNENENEAQLYAVDEAYAQQAGFPVLAAVCHELDHLQRSQASVANGHYISGRDVETMLRRVLSMAVGEASERVRIILEDQSHDGVPGVPTIPKKLAEVEGRTYSETGVEDLDF